MGLRQAAILLLVAAAAGLIIGWLWNGALWGERYAQLGEITPNISQTSKPR